MSSNELLTLESYGGTDVGMKRRLNEDVFLVGDEVGMYLVCDGMGGHAAGEVASRLAADQIHACIREQMGRPHDTWPAHWDQGRSSSANLLVDAVLAGHESVTRAVNHDKELKGMGTTVVAAIRPERTDKLIVGHVGDSRAYRLRGGELHLLTEDHSWVHEQVAAGFLTEEAARTHPLKNVVTQALGGSQTPRVDVLETDLKEGDVFLLCSDGLNSMLRDDEIAAILRSGGGLEEMVRRLIVNANERGGNDNITVVMLQAV